MYQKRKEYAAQLEKEFEGSLISYVTSDRAGFETQIASDAIDFFIAHLDRIGVVRSFCSIPPSNCKVHCTN